MIYTIDELSSRIRPVAEKYHLKAVYLFGSYTRGEAGDDSDIDLLVDLSGADLSGFLQSVVSIMTWKQLCRKRSISLQPRPLNSRAAE